MYPDMVPVESSMLASVGYDPERRELYLEFRSGGVYVYAEVSPARHRELLAAASLGRYVNQAIKPNHACRLV